MDELDPPRSIRLVARVGIVSWSMIGVALVLAGIVGVLAAVSELVLPLLFAVLLGAVCRPIARRLEQRGLPPSAAAAIVVLGIVVVAGAVSVLVVKTVIDESSAVAAQIDQAIEDLGPVSEDLGLDEEALGQLRDSVGSLGGVVAGGLLTAVIGGLGAVVGFVGGTILALLIMYYVLKDGTAIREWLISLAPEHLQGEVDDFLGKTVRSIRSYWAGRTILSAVVTMVVVAASLLMGLPLVAVIAVVNFVGGFIPYIGAVLGGGLVTLVTLSNRGFVPALAMLAVVFVANLLLENLLEPRIMSSRLTIHPLVVLIATTTGGVIGGIVGLILAVPATVVALDIIARVRRHLEIRPAGDEPPGPDDAAMADAPTG